MGIFTVDLASLLCLDGQMFLRCSSYRTENTHNCHIEITNDGLHVKYGFCTISVIKIFQFIAGYSLKKL